MDDDVECNLDELVSGLRYTPTIAYTTYNHRQNGKGNRYRLLYLFRIAISDTEVYKCTYQYLTSNLGFKLNDNCGGNVTQAIYGSNEQCQIIQTENTYSIHHFDSTWFTEAQQKEKLERWERKQKRAKQKERRAKVKGIFIKIFGQKFYNKLRK